MTNLRKSVADIRMSAGEYKAEARDLDAILAQFEGIEVLDPAVTLCRPDCRIEIDGRYLYSDENHLSVFGAHLFEADLKRALGRLLGERDRR